MRVRVYDCGCMTGGECGAAPILCESARIQYVWWLDSRRELESGAHSRPFGLVLADCLEAHDACLAHKEEQEHAGHYFDFPVASEATKQ